MEDMKSTPKKTIHDFCHYCVQSRSDAEVEMCGGSLLYSTTQPCPFFPYRIGKRPPIKVIRQFCLECMGGSPSLVRECEKEDCPMHFYRFGKNQARKGACKDHLDAIRRPWSTLSAGKMHQEPLFPSRAIEDKGVQGIKAYKSAKVRFRREPNGKK